MPTSSPIPRATLLPITPATPTHLRQWLRLALRFSFPRAPILELNSPPFEYLEHVFFERSPADCVVWANRGGGKTFLGAVATMLDLVFKPTIEVRILGGSLEQSRRMHEHLRRLFDEPLLNQLLAAPITDRRVILKNGSRAEILAQSQRSVRGTRVQKLRCDEVELFDPDVWQAAQLVTRSAPIPGPWGDTVRGCVEAISTMHRPHGLMWDLVSSCEEGTRHQARGTCCVPVTRGPFEPPVACATDPPQAGQCSCHASTPRPPSPITGPPLPDPQSLIPDPRQPRRLFRWGLLDSLEHCPPARDCATCLLFDDCRGRAKNRNPGGHIAISDAVGMKLRVPREVWDSEMLCLRPSRTHSVYPEFDPAIHVFDADSPDPAGSLWIAGMDFGFRAPTVILFARLDPDNTLRIMGERVETETTIDAHAAAIKHSEFPTPAWIGADPAGDQRSEQTGISAIQALKRAGLCVRARRLPLQDGLRLVRNRLAPASNPSTSSSGAGVPPASKSCFFPPDPEPGTPDPFPSLLIHRRCEKLIESLARYHYPPDDLASLTPVKDGADHAPDALRYLIQNLDRHFRSNVWRYV